MLTRAQLRADQTELALLGKPHAWLMIMIGSTPSRKEIDDSCVPSPVSDLTHAYVTESRLMAAYHAVTSFNSILKDRANEVAAAHRTDLQRVTTTAIPGGVKPRAINPKTHQPVAFTVLVKAGKVVVHSA